MKNKNAITQVGLKVGVVDVTEYDEFCYSIDAGGDLKKLSEVKLCPYNQKTCKKERCISWENNHCIIFQSHKNNDRRSAKNGVDIKPDLVDALNNWKAENNKASQFPSSPTQPSKTIKR